MKKLLLVILIINLTVFCATLWNLCETILGNTIIISTLGEARNVSGNTPFYALFSNTVHRTDTIFKDRVNNIKVCIWLSGVAVVLTAFALVYCWVQKIGVKKL